MTEYVVLAATAWFLGFAPFLEIYVAVPAALALGLDPVSTVVWASFGNIAPLVLITVAYERLRAMPRVGPWLEGRTSERFTRLADRYGPLLVLVATPWIGVWAVAVTAVATGMNRRSLVLYASAGIVLYAIVIVAGIVAGLGWWSGSSAQP